MIISVGEVSLEQVSLRLRRERLIFGLTTERWKFDKTEWLTKVTSINNEAFSLKRSCLKEGSFRVQRNSRVSPFFRGCRVSAREKAARISIYQLTAATGFCA